MPKRLYLFLASLCLPLGIAAGLFTVEARKPVAIKKSDVAQVAKAFGDSCETSGVCMPKQATSTHRVGIKTNARVVRVVDGDTFIAALDNEPGEWKIRMLGINTPETVDPRKPVECFGKEASNELKTLLLGQRIRLEADPQADERDKYGRLLRNVYLEDGTDVNGLLIQQGYAYAYLSFPLDRKRKSELKILQELARASSVGLWSQAGCATHS